jgi:hypothetical protein
MTCPECGGKNFNWARRCDHCGKPLRKESDATITSSDQPDDALAAVDPPAILITMMALEMNTMMRAIAAACVVALCVAALWCRRGLSAFNRIVEVTPFGLSEIREDGTIRRILWGQGLTLRNHEMRRRIELSVQDASLRIEIPYSVVGCARLAELIVKRGGFVHAESHPLSEPS